MKTYLINGFNNEDTEQNGTPETNNIIEDTYCCLLEIVSKTSVHEPKMLEVLKGGFQIYTFQDKKNNQMKFTFIVNLRRHNTLYKWYLFS